MSMAHIISDDITWHAAWFESILSRTHTSNVAGLLPCGRRDADETSLLKEDRRGESLPATHRGEPLGGLKEVLTLDSVVLGFNGPEERTKARRHFYSRNTPKTRALLCCCVATDE